MMKNPLASAGDVRYLGSTSGSEDSLEEGMANPLHAPFHVFLPEETHGERRLAVYGPLSHRESETSDFFFLTHSTAHLLHHIITILFLLLW